MLKKISASIIPAEFNSMAKSSIPRNYWQQPSTKIISFAIMFTILYILIWSSRLQDKAAKVGDFESSNFDTVQVKGESTACPICAASQDEYQPIVHEDDLFLVRTQTDKNLVDQIRTKWLQAPSTSTPTTIFNANETKFDKQMNQTSMEKMHKTILQIFRNKKNGFFIESNAFNRFGLSNTVYLEVKQKWTGVIVEPDPLVFKTLQKMNRNAWLINACLGVHSFPETISLTRINGSETRSKMKDDFSTGTNDTAEFEAKCFQFVTILAAVLKNHGELQNRLGNAGPSKNQLVVDYWSLAVEAAEVTILRTIPWDYVYIKIITIETRKPRDEKVRIFLETRNYLLVEKFGGPNVHDALYVNKRYIRELQPVYMT